MFAIGGAEQWCVSLMRYLERYYVSDLCTKELDRMALELVPRSCKVHNNLHVPDVDLLISIALADYPDTKVPIVTVVHGVIDTVWIKGIIAGTIREAERRDDFHIAAVTDVAKGMFPLEYRGRIKIIENGAEQGRCYGPDMGFRKLWPGKRIVGYLGRMTSEKGIQHLFEASRYLDPEEYHIVVAGPMHYCHCQYLFKKLPANMSYIGALLHPGGFYNSVDCIVVPSESESHCLVLNEAWLAGVRTVSCDYPVNQLFRSRHGNMSVLVPVKPKGQVLACGIIDSFCVDYREHAACVAREHYTAQHMVKRWEEYFDTVLAEPSPRMESVKMIHVISPRRLSSNQRVKLRSLRREHGIRLKEWPVGTDTVSLIGEVIYL